MKREILLRWKGRQRDIHTAAYVIMGTGWCIKPEEILVEHF